MNINMNREEQIKFLRPNPNYKHPWEECDECNQVVTTLPLHKWPAICGACGRKMLENWDVEYQEMGAKMEKKYIVLCDLTGPAECRFRESVRTVRKEDGCEESSIASCCNRTDIADCPHYNEVLIDPDTNTHI